MFKSFYSVPVLIVIVLAVSAPSPAQSAPGDVVTLGKRFVDLLAKEDYAGAAAQFDETMTAALPQAKLGETWQAVQGKVGKFQKQLGASAGKTGGYDVVLVTCQFEQTALDVKVVFDAKGLVAGLFFVPSRAAAEPAGPPSYAQPGAYREKEFTVGKGEWQLPGTLTMPSAVDGPWPAVVLVHGSGPNDRDETVGANKPFRDLAWGLASKGIAVLRYEKRTKQYAEKFKAAGVGKLTVQEESIDDALSAVAQLRTTEGVDAKRVFVLGHSLGGMLAPRIAQADPQIAGLILMAGATRPLEDLIVEQTRYLMSLQEKPKADDEAKLVELQSTVSKIKALTPADSASSSMLLGAPASYWLDLRRYDPLATAKGLKQPLLILQGERDYQVTQVDFARWKEALGAHANVAFKMYPKLNHLFIAGEGKSTPAEYEQPGHVAETVVADIAQWVSAQSGVKGDR